jgi:hypothetical protein
MTALSGQLREVGGRVEMLVTRAEQVIDGILGITLV